MRKAFIDSCFVILLLLSMSFFTRVRFSTTFIAFVFIFVAIACLRTINIFLCTIIEVSLRIRLMISTFLI